MLCLKCGKVYTLDFKHCLSCNQKLWKCTDELVYEKSVKKNI